MNLEDEESRKKIQQEKMINLFRKELSEQAKCDSESSFLVCENCNCWKVKRIFDNVDSKSV
jgi:hypothetical protein